MMSRRLRDNADFLRVLAKSNPKLRRAILKCCNPELIKAVCEVALNVLKGVVPVSEQQKKKLKRYKRVLRALTDKKVSITKKREFLNQTGGNFLPFLIPPVLSVLASLISKKL
jgi:hypothetical protein